jgi:predicted SAM-dependent methyltransferase
MKHFLKSVVSYESRQALRFDVQRLRVRVGNFWRRNLAASTDRLHLGCGRRRVEGWLNVDVSGSDLNVDLSCPLPWRDQQFSVVVSQHVIEHLELHRELLPLLREIRRVCKPRAKVWLSTPDLAQVCRSYHASGGADLLADRLVRQPGWSQVMSGLPASQMINHLFHQMGQHKNLLDYDLLNWALTQAGFINCRRVNEQLFLENCPEFPVRQDDWQSLYVQAELGPVA